jgi:hypothetical protein
LVWLKEQGCPWGNLTINYVYRNLEIMEWLKAEDCPRSKK